MLHNIYLETRSTIRRDYQEFHRIKMRAKLNLKEKKKKKKIELHSLPLSEYLTAFLERFHGKGITEHVFSIIQFAQRIIAAIDFKSSPFSRGE